MLVPLIGFQGYNTKSLPLAGAPSGFPLALASSEFRSYSNFVASHASHASHSKAHINPSHMDVKACVGIHPMDLLDLA